MSFLSCIIVVGGLTLTVYGVSTYFRLSGLLAESSALVKNALPYEQQGATDAPTVLFIGDSTGVGVGAKPEESLAGRYGAEYPTWNVVNLSVSGRRTAELLPVLKNLETGRYERVIIQVGGNDITYFSPLEQLKKDIADVLAEAKRVGKKVTLISCGNVGNAPIFPRPVAFLWSKRTLAVRSIFMEAATKAGVSHVDLYREGADDPFAREPLRYHARDLFHPSGEGYGLWYEDLKKSL